MSSLTENLSKEDKKQHEYYECEEQNQLIEFFKFLWEYFEVAEKWKEVQNFCAHHPVGSVFLLVTLGMCSVPVIIFLVFVFSSLVFTFLGFLFVEGTLLAVSTFILGGALLLVGMLALCFSMFLVCSYYFVQIGSGVFKNLGKRLGLSAFNWRGESGKEE
ncbi:hypothetical protein MAR_028364 [Mya arenaria]|uniref:Promethin n=1 Tax=Mya arenaria TaxID=6604 RepID=A0ABY7DGW8_MYAAR|nr:uncharacterized protein LOC128221179 [Mya arenaria]XP_052785621.1 uncharacterized protein LOC128221179 [Mya arenaria]WAQ95674.1 hypothetical protein MAR_028364 [Mya arenaria]